MIPKQKTENILVRFKWNPHHVPPPSFFGAQCAGLQRAKKSWRTGVMEPTHPKSRDSKDILLETVAQIHGFHAFPMFRSWTIFCERDDRFKNKSPIPLDIMLACSQTQFFAKKTNKNKMWIGMIFGDSIFGICISITWIYYIYIYIVVSINGGTSPGGNLPQSLWTYPTAWHTAYPTIPRTYPKSKSPRHTGPHGQVFWLVSYFPKGFGTFCINLWMLYLRPKCQSTHGTPWNDFLTVQARGCNSHCRNNIINL